MKRNRMIYALPLACLLAAGVSRVASADNDRSDPPYNQNTYGTTPADRAQNLDPSRPNDNTLPDASQSGTSGQSQYGQDQQSSTGSSMKDAAITAKVKSALMSERDLPSSQISVQTNDGVVQLNGFLNSQDEIDRAVSAARHVKDVKSVENNLQTK